MDFGFFRSLRGLGRRPQLSRSDFVIDRTYASSGGGGDSGNFLHKASRSHGFGGERIRKGGERLLADLKDLTHKDDAIFQFFKFVRDIVVGVQKVQLGVCRDSAKTRQLGTGNGVVLCRAGKG